MPELLKKNLTWFLTLVFVAGGLLARIQSKVEAMEPVKEQVTSLAAQVKDLETDVGDIKKKLKQSNKKTNDKLDIIINNQKPSVTSEEEQHSGD